MKKFIAILLLTVFYFSAKSQQNEYFFRFVEPNKNIINTIITRTISIEGINHDTVYAYANSDELIRFEKLGYKYTLLPKPSSLNAKTSNMALTIDEMATWDKYPTYSVYRSMMKRFEHDYPALCKLDSIGTTHNGHKIYVIKLSKNVTIEEPEVEVFYTSTIHGDETTGFVLMLRLIDYMLSNYSTNSRIASMLNSMAIYINPVSNPDGTYYSNDNTVFGAVRSNVNGKDLNRNFPDPRVGLNPTGPWEQETIIMMSFAAARHFTLSANFHGGQEVVNYPWDTWTSSQKTHPDNNWFIHFSRQYADSVHAVNPAYLTYMNNGITNGGDWYVIAGGRQDYMNWWQHCKEVTIELSNAYILSSDLLPTFWTYNRGAFLSYLESAKKGFNGIVTNSSSNPIKAKVFISGHDTDSSYVNSSQTNGFYARPIEPGTWQVTYSSPGFVPQTHTIIISNWNSSIVKNVQLIPEYTVTFNINDGSTPLIGATVNFNGSSKLTSTNGQAIFINVPEGNSYNYTISLSGYYTANGQVDIIENKTFNIELVPDITTVYSVTFDINHLSIPIANATIIFNGVEQQTSSSGIVTFTNIIQGSGYSYTISKAGYNTITGQIDISKDTTLYIDLQPITYSLNYIVKHLGVAIANANVDFNGTLKQTEIYGTVSFTNVPYGIGYNYTVSKSGYRSVAGKVDVTSGKNIEIELIPEYTVLFNIRSIGDPAANVTVIFNSLNQLTASDGKVLFSNVLYGNGYSYTVRQAGYHSINGQVDVTANKIINIKLIQVGVLTPPAKLNILEVWPNPFSSEINIKFTLDKPSFVNLSIYSIDGSLISVIANGKYPGGLMSFRWTSMALKSGSSIIRLQVDEKTFSQIIQHIP